jgi:hypothetical protein
MTDSFCIFLRFFSSQFLIKTFFSVFPQMVDLGSGQGRREVETAGVAALRRGSQPTENAGLGQKMPFVE